MCVDQSYSLALSFPSPPPPPIQGLPVVNVRGRLGCKCVSTGQALDSSLLYQLHARRRIPQIQDWLPYLFAGSGLVPYKTCHKEGPESDGVTWVAVPSCTERRIGGSGVFPWHLPHDYPAIAILPLCSFCPPPRMPSPVQSLEIPSILQSLT